MIDEMVNKKSLGFSTTEIAEQLKHTMFFNVLSLKELKTIINSSETVHLPANWQVIREGDLGVYLYYILSGNLQIFTINNKGQEIVLDMAGPGEYVGEQALLPGEGRKRNASIRTFEPSDLLRIHKDDFNKALEKNNPLKSELQKKASAQGMRIISRQSNIFQSLKLDNTGNWSEEKSYNERTKLFSEGDIGNYYYLVLEGKVTIWQGKDNTEKLLAELGTGQGFGEIALLKNSLRTTTAIAEKGTRLLLVDGNVFRNQYVKTPELREYIQTLQNVYNLRDFGLITQHSGKFEDKECITTVFHLDNGRTAFSAHVIGSDIVSIEYTDIKKDEIKSLRYVDRLRNIEREIKLTDGKIMGITSNGLWRDLGIAYNLMLTDTILTEEQLARYLETGQINDEQKLIDSRDDIVCHCTQTSYGKILEGIDDGFDSLEKIGSKFLCGALCGGCKPQLKEILGENGWYPVMMAEEFEVVPNIRSFRFKPFDNILKDHKAGQHIIIKAPIDGKWIKRPYTISSSATEVNFKEITVKREKGGQFSNWIFDHYDPKTILQLSDPQGDYYINIEESTPVVCFAAGIGVTPGLSMMRSIASSGVRKRLHLDYSCEGKDNFIYKKEIDDMVEEFENLTVFYRDTSSGPRITSEDIISIVDNYKDADFYICGPQKYQQALKENLKLLNVEQEKINVEEFSAYGDSPSESSNTSLGFDRIYPIISLSFVFFLIVQSLLGINWPFLTEWQSLLNYQMGTGLLLFLFIVSQWYYPVLRWKGELRLAAKHLRYHKLIGAFTPVIFFIHSTSLGYAYALLLSIVFLVNTILSLLIRRESLDENNFYRSYRKIWLPVHIILSVSLMSLVFYHIWVAIFYK